MRSPKIQVQYEFGSNRFCGLDNRAGHWRLDRHVIIDSKNNFLGLGYQKWIFITKPYYKFCTIAIRCIREIVKYIVNSKISGLVSHDRERFLEENRFIWSCECMISTMAFITFYLLITAIPYRSYKVEAVKVRKLWVSLTSFISGKEVLDFYRLTVEIKRKIIVRSLLASQIAYW